MLARVQQVPGFFVAGVFGVGAMRGEDNGRLCDEGFGGEDIPDIVLDKVDGEVIDLPGGVGVLVGGVKAAGVGAAVPAVGAFGLDALEAAILFDAYVVAGRVSPGLGDVEAAFGGAGHEEQFDPFAALFVGCKFGLACGRRFVEIFSQGSTSPIYA